MKTPIRALIVDDEPIARRAIRSLLANVDWLVCVGEAADGAEALDLIRKVSPELLFLDVRMPGLTGLEVLRRSATSVPVIFTTAYDDYAFVAFELGAIDYLRKPFGAARLSRALERARPHLEAARTRSSSAAGASLDERLAFAENVPSPLDRLFVRHGGEVIPVRLTDVSRFEADGDYVAVYAAGRRHLVYLNLRDLAERLDAMRFVRIHRSHVINLDHVSGIVNYDAGRLQVRMRDGTRIIASRAGSRILRARWK